MTISDAVVSFSVATIAPPGGGHGVDDQGVPGGHSAVAAQELGAPRISPAACGGVWSATSIALRDGSELSAFAAQRRFCAVAS